MSLALVPYTSVKLFSRGVGWPRRGRANKAHQLSVSADGGLSEVHRRPASKAHPRRVGVGIRGGGMVRRSAEDAPR